MTPAGCADDVDVAISEEKSLTAIATSAIPAPTSDICHHTDLSRNSRLSIASMTAPEMSWHFRRGIVNAQLHCSTGTWPALSAINGRHVLMGQAA